MKAYVGTSRFETKSENVQDSDFRLIYSDFALEETIASKTDFGTSS